MMARRLIPIGIIILTVAACAASFAQQDVLRFEAEDISEPKDAWLVNQMSETHWNLWSTDQNAEQKWSGGVVLRSPEVHADRDTPECGAPPLHSTVTGIPAGTWQVSIGGVGRPIAISFDGETWRRHTGRDLGVFEITDGHFEVWVDDRFASADNPGSTYYDYLEFTPAAATRLGVLNGDFEFITGEDGISGWTWWCREEGAGSAELVTDVVHEGERSVYIEHTGERDFALSNRGSLPVEPRDKLTATAWVRTEGEGQLSLAFVARKDGEVVSWNVGSFTVRGETDWRQIEAVAGVRRNIDEVYVRFTGQGEIRAWVDDVRVQRGWPELVREQKPLVEGWATERVEETLGRGLVAMPMDNGRVYLGWRMLRDDPSGIGFDVYRRAGDEGLVKLTEQPITQTTDFVDENPVPGVENLYAVRPVYGDREGETTAPVGVTPSEEGRNYISIPLQGDYDFQKVGVGDLNGDGNYDYVIKQPNKNVDPWHVVWYPSESTYKVEAYLSDGTLLWSKDLGWSIEQGAWYSPMLVRDVTGDGRAEVILKIGPDEDIRDEDGMVQDGPEWLAVFDGMTGEEIARADWPSREGFESYNLASRNQMAIAYLDGRTPCIVVLRGTYGLKRAQAWQLREGALEELWSWDNEDLSGIWRGQGAHSMHAVDVDGDGRDEVFLGSMVLDDNGVPLWTTGLGHPDHHYVGDIDPTRPGLEVYYGIESRASADGCSLFCAATGEWLWGLDQPTIHVHGAGLVSDIDPRYPGMECYSGERDVPEDRWLWSAQGELIEKVDIGGLSPRAVHWDATLQREIIVGRRIQQFRGEVYDRIEGSVVGFADILGDWREEIITALPGELRIYSTTIPANDRRVTLMQDPLYRNDVCIQAMGYLQVPMMTRLISAGHANLSLLSRDRWVSPGEQSAIEVVVTAPSDAGVQGTVQLEPGPGVDLEAAQVEVNVAAGQVARYPVTATVRADDSPIFVRPSWTVTARMEGDLQLEAGVTLEPLDLPLTEFDRTQATAIAAQGGGTVEIRDDKVGDDGDSFSHWDDEGHWVEWMLTAPADGRYTLVLRYCSIENVRRAVAVNGEEVAEAVFTGTGGFSSSSSDWVHDVVRDADGEPVLLSLSAGEHRVRLTNADGNGMNVDYLLLHAE